MARAAPSPSATATYNSHPSPGSQNSATRHQPPPTFNNHNASNLQHPSLSHASFCLKKGSLWQQNRGQTENISHFFLRFFDFLGLLALQPIAFQEQATIRPLQTNMAQKPTVGFSVFRKCANIGP
jgi:hypothetical protein